MSDDLRPPLDGVLVINAGQILAAPFCATMLAEFGADVIKLERPGTGEPNHGTISYVQDNRSQRGVTCNLQDPRGQELFRELCSHADILIENFRPGTLERLDVGPDRLREQNPGLVVVRISGYGQTGPYRDRAGFDRVALGFSGATYATGTPDGPPVRPGYMVADYSTGVFAAFGAMAALRARELNGVGQDVDIGLYESIWKQSGSIAANYQRSGENRERTGNYFPGITPGRAVRDGRRALPDRQRGDAGHLRAALRRDAATGDRDRSPLRAAQRASQELSGAARDRRRLGAHADARRGAGRAG